MWSWSRKYSTGLEAYISSFHGYSMLRQSFGSLGVCILNDAPNGYAIFKLVHYWLSDTTNPRWLLIFDGYNDPNQFYIQDYYRTPLLFMEPLSSLQDHQSSSGVRLTMYNLSKFSRTALASCKTNGRMFNPVCLQHLVGGLSSHVAKVIKASSRTTCGTSAKFDYCRSLSCIQYLEQWALPSGIWKM